MSDPNPKSSPAQIAPAGWPFYVRNLSGVFGVTLLFLIFNLLTYNYYPAVWCDEAAYSEPAMNFQSTGSFHTYLSHTQPHGTFSVMSCPGYFLVLAPWIKLLGSSVLAVRSFNYVMMAVAVCVLSVTLLRFGLVRSRMALAALAALLHLGYGMSFAYRCSRPDILGLNSILLIALSFSWQRPWPRRLALFGSAALSVWFGIQVGAFIGFAIMAAWLLLPWVRWREVLVVALGGLAGTAAMLLLIASQGVLSHFFDTAFALMGKRYGAATDLSLEMRLWHVITGSLSSYVGDFSAVPLLLVTVLLAFLFWKRFNFSTKRAILYLLVLAIVTPLYFDLTGHWAFYYSYMKFVPCAVGLWTIGAALYRDHPAIYRRLYMPTAVTAILAAMVVGLPLRLALVWKTSTIMPRSDMAQIIGRHLTAGDVVYSEYAAFFEAKQIAHVIYTSWSSRMVQWGEVGKYDLSDSERSAITAMIIQPKHAAPFIEYMGGEWQPVTEPFGDRQNFDSLTKLPLIGKRFAAYATQPQSERFQIQIFRRVPLSGATNAPVVGESKLSGHTD